MLITDHRIIHVGRNLFSSLGQPPAQSSVSHWDCSGPRTVHFWISTGKDPPQPLWETHNSVWLPTCRKTVSLESHNLPCSNFSHLLLVLSLCISERDWIFFSLYLPQTLISCRQQKGLPGIFFSASWTQLSQPLLLFHVLQLLGHLNGPPLDSLQFIFVFLYWEDQNWK